MQIQSDPAVVIRIEQSASSIADRSPTALTHCFSFSNFDGQPRQLEPAALACTLEALILRRDQRAADVKSRLVTLETAAPESRLGFSGSTLWLPMRSSPPDEVLLEQIALRRRSHDEAPQALSHAKAMVQPMVAIDAEMIGKFSSLLTEMLANGDIHARKAYLRSIIDVVEIDDKLILIVGRRSTLRNAISGRPAGFANISGFDREWRTRVDQATNIYVFEIMI